MFDNFVTITGNMTRDPELRFTQAGKPVCSFSIAHNTRYKDANGEWQDGDPSFFDCTAWADLGEHVAGSIVKGQRCTVIGKLKQRTWTDKDDNERRSIDIICDEVSGSLKWGTTTFERVQKGGGGGHTSDVANQPAPAHRPPDPVYGDEEPF